MSINIKQLNVGDSLPELQIPLTARQIVSGAIASQDFEDVHHDKAAAQDKGTADIFMNILTTNGLVGRYMTDWSGPEFRIKRIQLKLGAPNYPGDTMVFTGQIDNIEQGEITVAFKGKNSLGNHVSGSAYLVSANTLISNTERKGDA